MPPSSEEIRERPRTSCLRFATLGLLLPGVLFAVGVTIGIPVAVMVGLGIVGFFGWLAWLVVLGVDWMRQHQRRTESPESVAARTAARPADLPDPVYSVFAVAAPVSTEPKSQMLGNVDTPGCGFGCLLAFAPFWLPIAFGPAVWSVFHIDRLPNAGLVAAVSAAFLCVGLLFIRMTIRAGFVWAADREVGAFQVELSDTPVRPGGRYRLRIGGPRTTPLQDLLVELVCTESLVSSDGEGGSNVASSEVVRLRLEGGAESVLPLEIDIDFPADIMPSFRTATITIAWEIQISGRLSARFTRLARFHRRYSFEIEPNR